MKKIILLFGIIVLSAIGLLAGSNVASAADFWIAPASDTYKMECEYSVNIMIDTEGVDSNAADAVIEFNPAEIEFIDQVTNMPGTQVKPGTTYQMYPGNVINETEGRVYLTGFNVIGGYNGSGVYGSLVFRSKPGITSTSFNFYYVVGGSTDSNIADMLSNDILDGVAGASYNFIPGPCVDDTTPPWVTNPSPTPGQRGVPLDSNIAFNLRDNLSGVDLDSVQIFIDGIEYTLAGPNTFTYTGDALNYRITVDPIQDFLPDTPVRVEIRAQDLAANIMNPYIYTFNEPIVDLTPPYVRNPDPSPGERGVPLDADVAFNILDDQSGVDIDTVVVSIDGITYQLAGPNVFTYTGDTSNYRVTINTIQDFPDGQPIVVEINARDLAGNIMTPYRYIFNEPVPPPPTCEELGCTCEVLECGLEECEECEPCEPCPEVPEAPDVTVPEDQRVGTEYVEFWTAGHTIELIPSNNGYISILPSFIYAVELDATVLPNPASSVQWMIGSSVYQMARTSDGLLYKVSVQSDFTPGNYPARLVITYLDGATDVLDFGVTVVPWGYVYEEIDGQQFAVQGANITLLNEDGSFWPGNAYAQTNPTYSTNSGTFGYMVLPGGYRIQVNKEGYRQREISYNSNLIINPGIELLRLPEELPPVEDVTEFIAAVGENIEYGIDVAQEEFFDDPEVEDVADTAGVAFLAALAAVNLASLASMAGFLPYLFSIFSEPILALFRKKRKKYGVVYDSITKRPIDLAIVRLYDRATNKLVKTKVTDKQGRYAFIAKPGKYYITAFKKDYEFPSQLLAGIKEDVTYIDVYHGEEINVGEQTMIVPNIPLDPHKKAVPSKKIKLIRWLRKFQRFLALLGPVSALFIFIIKPDTFSFVLLIVHIVIYAIFRRLAVPKKPKGWGIVLDKNTRKPIANSIVRIYDSQYNRLLDTQVTDRKGRYNFLVGKNVYYITAEKSGYESSKSESIEQEKPEGDVITKNILLSKNGHQP